MFTYFGYSVSKHHPCRETDKEFMTFKSVVIAPSRQENLYRPF